MVTIFHTTSTKTLITYFLSADTIIQAPADSQSYNRYSYVRNNPLMYTDPSGHSWLSKTWKKIKNNADRIVGAVMVAIGGLMTAAGNPYGPGLMATGVGLINGDYALFNGNGVNIQYSVTFTTSYGQSSNSLTPHQEEIIRQSRELDRLQARTSGTYNRMGGGKFANGGASGSYDNMDGENNLGHISVTAQRESNMEQIASALLADIGSIAYTAFTFTNVGAIYDTISQYRNGEISTTELLIQGGAGLLLGGAGAKAVKYGFSSFKEARTLYSQWGKGSFDRIKDNIRDHVEYRGNGDYAKYLRQASNFNKRGANSSGLRDDGSILYKRRNGEFLIERDGLIVTYGRN